MRLRALTLAVALALAPSGASLHAQEPGTVEIGGFGQATRFDDQSGISDATAFGGGGLLGVFLARDLALEFALARSWTEDASPAGVDGVWTPFRARFVYAIPASDRVRPLVGLGYVRNDYADLFPAHEGDNGASALVGFKAYLTHRLAFRSDFTVDHMLVPFNEGADVSGTVNDLTNWTATAGLSIDLGPGRSRDTDADGVRDRDDACLGTPMGVRVGADGCRVDSDGDGVFDEDDRCAATPSGVRVDASGCRIDTDGDGVFDEDDQCANTPAGATVDATGCRVDSDGDGVFDDNDRCAATPAGATVDATGCRVDTDGDGVFDDEDRCGATPAGTEVDAVGCPVLFEEEQVTLVLEGVNFETNSANLTTESLAILNRVASSLNGNPDVRVRVTGHTDSTGSRSLNLDLSQRRAQSVAAYLASRGVAQDRMETVGVGPDQPIATNDTEEGRRANRRVELERIN